MRAKSLCPPRARPRRRVICGLAPLSSTNTRWAVSSGSQTPHASAPFFRRPGSGRSCSAAARVFFKPPTQPPQPGDRSWRCGKGDPGPRPTRPAWRRLFGQRRWCRRCFRSSVSSVLRPHKYVAGFQCAALAKLLTHATHRRDAEARKLRDLPRVPASFVEFQNALADRNRYGSHEHNLP